MATQKKGQGIAFKIPGPDGDAAHAVPTDADVRQTQPRTGIGLLSRVIANAQGDTEEVARLNEEVSLLKLQVGEQFLDPKLIRLTRWADRHPDSFANAAFREFKEEIRIAAGNVQAVRVRPIRGAPSDGSAPRFELVYGSRRTRACLELGLLVRAVVGEDLTDQALYIQMQRENRGRSNLSAWEQGVSYHRALKEGLFPSARRLAEEIGLDHSNVSKALRVAELPEEIVGAFPSPCDIQFRWAVALDKALLANRDAVLAAARRLATKAPRPRAQEAFQALTHGIARKAAKKAETGVLEVQLANGKKVAIRAGKGGSTTIDLPRGVLPQTRWDAFQAGLTRLLTELARVS
jgi:ParB family transcriptional regulator, chromosome partitioning protein